MEEFVLKLINDIKLNFNAASLIKAGIIIILTVAAVIVLTIVYRKLRAKQEKLNDLRKTSTYRIIYRIIRALIIITGVIAVLQSVGINLIGLSASFALVVLLLVLAVKDALQDVFAGFVIMSDKFFNVGDAVEYEGNEGIIVSFTARTTKIEFLEDRSVLSVANRNISKIRKLTHLVDIDIPLPYELGRKEAFSVLSSICEKIRLLEGVESCELKGTQDFGASAVIYKIRFFCEPHDRPDIRRSVLKTIQDGLEKAGIRIPYQQIDVHRK
ncbi:MAG: mechanosensitive ion channel family protein [Clostridia bacterium]|nr:mechanosensitive ion channel family protein [Clostridia bacterium]